MSALHRFVETNHNIEELRQLINGGENPNSKNNLERTPLHTAILRCENNPQLTNEILMVVRELVKLGANVDEGDGVDMTPLQLAVITKNKKMIETLLQVNADINKQECRGWTALHFATRKSHSPELGIVKLLLKYKPDVNAQTRNRETPLMFAIHANNLYIFLELLKHGPSLTMQDNYGETVMNYALKKSDANVKIVLELAKRGCSFNENDFNGFTAREVYLDGLCDIESSEQMSGVLEVIKLFVLDGRKFTMYESLAIQRFEKKNYELNLDRSLDLFQNVVKKMRKDELAPNCTVYDIAFRGTFHKANAIDDRFTVEAFDAVLNRLMSGEYPDFCEMILSGICSFYIDRKVAGILFNTVSDIHIFEYDLLMVICKCLEKSDKLNIMIVCCKDF